MSCPYLSVTRFYAGFWIIDFVLFQDRSRLEGTHSGKGESFQLFPQKLESNKIQINHSQLLLSLLPNKPFPQEPHPHPLSLPLFPKSKRSRSNQEQPDKPLLPHPLLLHPQFVAVKSLIFLASVSCLCFIVCAKACQSCIFFIKGG